VIVVDASAMVHALVGEGVAPGLLDELSNPDLHAPALLDYEVASALRGHALGGRLGRAALGESIADFAALQIERYPMAWMLDDVLALRENFTVYDAAYIVLARALNAPLVTCDTKLSDANRLGIQVRTYE
jgi:predicted nucleic acid-binding protein